MPGKINSVIVAAVVSAAFLCAGCAATHDPEDWSMSVHKMPEHVYGSWVWMTLEKTETQKKAESFGGELIAVSADSLYVASPALRVVSRKSIVEVRLVQYDSYAVGIGGLTVLGNLSTISNGVFGLLTGPMWIIGGTIAAIERSFTPIADYTGATCGAMFPFARYPAGFPGGIDRNLIIQSGKKRPYNFF
jgi:hypothetical protein